MKKREILPFSGGDKNPGQAKNKKNRAIKRENKKSVLLTREENQNK